MNQFEQDVINRATVKLAGIGNALSEYAPSILENTMWGNMAGAATGNVIGAGLGAMYGAYTGDSSRDNMYKSALMGSLIGSGIGTGLMGGAALRGAIYNGLADTAEHAGDVEKMERLKKLRDAYYPFWPTGGVVGGLAGGLLANRLRDSNSNGDQ